MMFDPQTLSTACEQREKKWDDGSDGKDSEEPEAKEESPSQDGAAQGPPNEVSDGVVDAALRLLGALASAVPVSAAAAVQAPPHPDPQDSDLREPGSEPGLPPLRGAQLLPSVLLRLLALMADSGNPQVSICTPRVHTFRTTGSTRLAMSNSHLRLLPLTHSYPHS